MAVTRGIKPFALCMTGISGSGKTTLANAVAAQLRDLGITVDVIDGDETRRLIGGFIGYSKDERIKMTKVNQAIGWHLLRNNISFILAVVAPYEEIRAKFREFFGNAYIEVYVKASVKTCAERDVKGLYKLYREGKVDHLNGSDDAFEPPANCSLTIDTDEVCIDDACKAIIEYLRKCNFIE